LALSLVLALALALALALSLPLLQMQRQNTTPGGLKVAKISQYEIDIRVCKIH
jgi:hypothetical protein